MSEKLTEIYHQDTDVVENDLSEMVKNLRKEVRVLFEPGTVDFRNITENLDLEEINSDLLEEVKKAVSGKVFEIMISGHFNDLRGAKELMEKLGIERVSISNEDIKDINKDLERLNQNNLVRLGVSQPPEMGKYDFEKAKEILIGAGYSENELSEDKIKKILDFRHMLLAFKERKINSIESLPDLLE